MYCKFYMYCIGRHRFHPCFRRPARARPFSLLPQPPVDRRIDDMAGLHCLSTSLLLEKRKKETKRELSCVCVWRSKWRRRLWSCLYSSCSSSAALRRRNRLLGLFFILNLICVQYCRCGRQSIWSPPSFFYVEFLVMCWKFPHLSARGGESGERPLIVDGLLVVNTTPTDAFHRYGTFANQRDGVKTALLMCRIRGLNNRTVKKYFFPDAVYTTKLVSLIKGFPLHNAPVWWQSPCRLEAQREEDGEKVT